MAHTERREARQIKREGIAGIIARGNHLAAQNDEPEPFTEDDWLAADLSRDIGKGPRLAARNDASAADAQMVHLDAMRRAGL